MRVVERPVTFPSHCAAIPFHAGSYSGRWVDTGAEIPASAKDSHVYLSEAAVEECAVLLGWTRPGEVEELRRDLGEVGAELARVTEELAAADRFREAVETFESAGFRARKKSGRPRKQQVEEEVAAA